MNEKNELTDLAEECGKDLTYLRTLLFAAEDKVQFYLSNKPLLGQYWELLNHHAAELGILLGMTREVLEALDEKMEQLSAGLYKTGPLTAG